MGGLRRMIPGAGGKISGAKRLLAERGAVSGFGRVGGVAAAARGSRENSPLVAFVSTERDHPGRSARAGLWLSSARQSLHQENDPSPVT